MAILLSHVLTLPCLCQEKTCTIGIELTSFLRSSVKLSISHNFSRHWSVCGEISLSYMMISCGRSTLETEHYGEFSSPTPLPPDPDHHSSTVNFSYWPDEGYSGFCFSAGVRKGDRSGTDIIAGTGYMIPIGRGLNVYAGLEIPLLQGIRGDRFSPQHIKACLYYRF